MLLYTNALHTKVFLLLLMYKYFFSLPSWIYEAAAYLIMSGVSKLMEARYKSLPPSQPDDGKHNSIKVKKRDKKKNRKVTDKDGTEEWEETQEWEKELEADPSVLENLP